MEVHMETFLTIAEVAKALGVSEYHVRRLVWRRRLPAVHVGRLVRIPASAIRELERRANEAVRPRV